MKTCTKCLEEKAYECFSKRSASKDGYQPNCKTCCKDYIQQWYSANKDKSLQGSLRWARENRERRNEISARYRKKNKAKANAATRSSMRKNAEKYKEIERQWRLANPEKSIEKCLRRRALKIANGVFRVTAKDIRRLLQKPCVYCGAKSEHIDHVIPLSKGGRHSVGNLVASCASCNLSKSNKFVMEWKVQSGCW